jgi:MFS family permease
LTRAFVALVVAHFVQALGYASSPLLPVYLDHLGASRTQIGAIMAVAAIAGLLFRPAVGLGLDRLGRKPTIVAGTMLLGSGMLLVGAVTDLGPTIYVARLTYGCGVAALFAGYFTWAADIVPGSRRTEGLALFGVSGLVPLALNPLVDEIGLTPPALRWVFPALGLLILASWLAVFRLPETKPHRTQQTPLTPRAVLIAFVDPSLWPVWLVTLLLAGMVQIFLAFATVAAVASGVDRPAALWLLYAGSAVAVRLAGGRLPDVVGPGNMIAPAIGLYGAAMLVAASATNTLGFMMAGLLGGLGHGITFPVLLSLLIARGDERLRGSLVAFYTALFAELTHRSGPSWRVMVPDFARA